MDEVEGVKNVERTSKALGSQRKGRIEGGGCVGGGEGREKNEGRKARGKEIKRRLEVNEGRKGQKIVYEKKRD